MRRKDYIQIAVKMFVLCILCTLLTYLWQFYVDVLSFLFSLFTSIFCQCSSFTRFKDQLPLSFINSNHSVCIYVCVYCIYQSQIPSNFIEILCFLCYYREELNWSANNSSSFNLNS